MKNRVSIVKCKSYLPDELSVKIREAVMLALASKAPEEEKSGQERQAAATAPGASAGQVKNAEDFRGKKVLLKPNILSGEGPEKAVTTHPEFVKQCVLLFRELGAAEVMVGDSPGFLSAAAAGKKSGIYDAVIEAGGKWADFSDFVTVKNPAGKLVKSFNIARVVKEADLIVSLPKMKNHQLLYHTGAMKNLFGVIPGLQKSAFHMRFSDREHFAQMIVDLNIAVKPALTIMDSIVAMEGPGPGSGTPVQAGLILASANPLALDIAAVRIMGYDPAEMPVIADALSRKKWLETAGDFETAGETIESVLLPGFERIKRVRDVTMFKDRLPPFLYTLARKAFVPRPVVNHDKCIECGYCVRICPAGALSLPTGPDSKIILDYKKCINCYCCHEICPAKAFTIKRLFFK